MLYQAPPVEATQVTRPFAEIVRLLPGTTALKVDKYTIGVLVPARADEALAGTGTAVFEGAWIISRPDGSYDVVSDQEFRQVRGFAPVPHARLATAV